MKSAAYSNTSTAIIIAMNAMVVFEFIRLLTERIDIGILN
jgi:hypothetical protein